MIPSGLFGRFGKEIGTVVYSVVAVAAAWDVDETVRMLVAVCSGVGALLCGAGAAINALTGLLQWIERRRAGERRREAIAGKPRPK